MNKHRRKELERIANEVEELASAVSIVANDEQDAFDNLPESLQSGERGSSMEETVDELGNVQCTLDDLARDIRDILER